MENEENVDEKEDADVVDNIFSLSQGHCQTLGDDDDDEEVIATQYYVEPIEDIPNPIGPWETHTHLGAHGDNDNVGLTLPSQTSPPSWMVEAMMNLNQQVVGNAND